MSRFVILLVVSSLSQAAPESFRYVDHARNDPRLKGYRTPEGFKLEIVAAEPLIQHPVAMAFSADGSLFVLEKKADPLGVPVEEELVFKDGTRRTFFVNRSANAAHLKLLEYDPANCRFIKARSVLSDDSPSCVTVLDGWIYLAGRGSIQRWNQKSILDRKSPLHGEVIIRGLHPEWTNLSTGPDGWLYVNTGPNADAEGADGSRARGGSGANLFRCRTDGSKLERVSTGLRSLGDVVFTEHLQPATIEGGKLVGLDEGIDRGSGNAEMDPHSTSAVFFRDGPLPSIFHNTAFFVSSHPRGIQAVRPGKSGSFSLVSSMDPNFRPVSIAIGPDGAIYIGDRRGDDVDQGRIYRLTWIGGPVPDLEEPVTAIELQPMDTWAKLLSTSGDSGTIRSLEQMIAGRDRTLAEHALKVYLTRPRTLKSIPEDQSAWYTDAEHARSFLQGLANGGEDAPSHTRLLALIGLQRLWDDSVRAFLLECIIDSDADVRRIACEGLGRFAKSGDEAASSALEKLLGDNSPKIRLAAAIAIGRLKASNAASVFSIAYRFDDGRIPSLTQAYLLGLDASGKSGIAQLLDLAQSGNDASLDKAVSAFLAIKSQFAIDQLPDLIANPHLSGEQRTALIRSFAKQSKTFHPIVGFLAKNPKQDASVYLAAIEGIVARSTKGREAGTVLASALRTDSDEVKLAALKGMRSIGTYAESQDLRGLIEGKASATVRGEGLRALHSVDAAAAGEVAGRWLTSNDVSLLSAAVEVAGASAEVADDLASKWFLKILPDELLPQVTDSLWRHRNRPKLADRRIELLKRWLRESARPANADGLRQLVIKRGDPARGKTAFVNAGCCDCHRIESVGRNHGPDLTNAWKSNSVEYLFESIIDPHCARTPGFEADSIRLRMPKDSIDQLRFDQLVDVVAFLKSRSARETMVGYVPEFLVYAPTSETLGWSPKSVGWNGSLDYRRSFKGAKSVDGIVFVECSTARKAEVFVMVAGSGELRVNGQRMRHLSDGEQNFPIRLHQGWNVIEVRTTASPERHAVAMRIPGEGIRFSTRMR